MSPVSAIPARRAGWLLDLSDRVLAVERRLLSVLMTLLVTLILVNVATRYGGSPIYWIDEAAVYSVVWLTFVGASVMTRLRMDFAVTLLTDRLGERLARWVRCFATLCTAALGVALSVMCWLWMDPLGIARAGFDAREFAATSFNFLYTERTQTLNWPVWVLQLILPWFASTLSLHALANLVEDLGWQPRRRHPSFRIEGADAVN